MRPRLNSCQLRLQRCSAAQGQKPSNLLKPHWPNDHTVDPSPVVKKKSTMRKPHKDGVFDISRQNTPAFHNSPVAGSSPTSSTTQSRVFPLENLRSFRFAVHRT